MAACIALTACNVRGGTSRTICAASTPRACWGVPVASGSGRQSSAPVHTPVKINRRHFARDQSAGECAGKRFGRCARRMPVGVYAASEVNTPEPAGETPPPPPYGKLSVPVYSLATQGVRYMHA
eukprot:1194898-Prorocentrum_minimum.AAC.3